MNMRHPMPSHLYNSDRTASWHSEHTTYVSLHSRKMEKDAELGRKTLFDGVCALKRCQALISQSPRAFIFENQNAIRRRRSGNILVQLLTDATREQYQRAARIIYYNERPFSDILKSDTPMNVANGWSFDTKIDFVAYLTGPTRMVLKELRDTIIESDPSLLDSVDTAMAPIPNEPDPHQDPAAFRQFLASEWKRNFFGFRTQRTDTMNRYVVSYALLWKAIIGDISRVCRSAGTILTKISSEVATVVFDTFASKASRPLPALRRICIAIHNSICRLKDVMSHYEGVFRAEPTANIIPPFIDVDSNEAELAKRNAAIDLRNSRDSLTAQLFENARQLCEILDSKPFRNAGTKNTVISAIQSKLARLSESDAIQSLISEVNMPFGLGLGSVSEMNAKYPLRGKNILKFPIILWLRHVFYGELLDNRNAEYERVTTFIQFSIVLHESPYAIYVDDYVSTVAPLNMLAETLSVSSLTAEQKQRVLAFGGMQFALDNIQTTISGPQATPEQKSIASSLTPFTYVELDAFIETCKNLYSEDKDRLRVVDAARSASDEIQDFVRLVDSKISDVSSGYPNGHFFGTADTFSIIASGSTRKRERELLANQLRKYDIEKHNATLQMLSQQLTSKIADLFGLYVSSINEIVREVSSLLEDGLVSAISRPRRPGRGGDRGGGNAFDNDPDGQITEFERLRVSLRNVANLWQTSLGKGIANTSDEALALIDASESIPLTVLRDRLQNDTLSYLSFIVQNGGPLFKQLKESSQNSARANRILSQMRNLVNLRNAENGLVIFASATKIAAEDLAYPTISQKWYWQSAGVIIFAGLGSAITLAMNALRASVLEEGQSPILLPFDRTASGSGVLQSYFLSFDPTLRVIFTTIAENITYITGSDAPQETITLFAVSSFFVAYWLGGVILPLLKSGASYLFTRVSSVQPNDKLAPGSITGRVASGLFGAGSSFGASFLGFFGLSALGSGVSAIASSLVDIVIKTDQNETVKSFAGSLLGLALNVPVTTRLLLVAAGSLVYMKQLPVAAVAKISGFGLRWVERSEDFVFEEADMEMSQITHSRSKEAISMVTRSILMPSGIPRDDATAGLSRVYADGPNLFNGNSDWVFTNLTYGLVAHNLYALGICGYDFMSPGYLTSFMTAMVVAGNLTAMNYKQSQSERMIIRKSGSASVPPPEAEEAWPDLTAGMNFI